MCLVFAAGTKETVCRLHNLDGTHIYNNICIHIILNTIDSQQRPGRGGPGGVVFGFDASMRKIMGDGEAGEVAKGVTSNRHLQVLCTWAKSRKIANLR